MLSDRKNTVQAKQWLDKCYSETMVKRWYADFKCSCTDTNDAKCSGYPNSAVVPENTKKLHKFVLANHKLKLHEIAKELISEGSVFTILHEHLSMRKLCSKWLPSLLTVDQKQQHIDDSERCLQLFQRNKKEFLCKYVRKDETWIHHFTLESNQLFQLPWERKNHQQWTLYSIIGAFEGRNRQKTATNEEKSALSPRQRTVSQVGGNNSKTTWTALWTASISTLSSRSGPPATTGYLQTSKECSRERDLAPMKKWYKKPKHILRPKTNHSTKKASNC